MSATTTDAPASVDESRPTNTGPTPGKPRKSRNPSARQMTWNAWLFLLVPGVLFVVFMALPIVIALVLSLTDYAICLLYTSPSPRDQRGSRMPSSA